MQCKWCGLWCAFLVLAVSVVTVAAAAATAAAASSAQLTKGKVSIL